MNRNEKKFIGRIIAALLAALMIIAVIPVTVLETFAETEATGENAGEDFAAANEVTNTATVTVSVTGNATVEINGIEQTTYTADIGTEVPVKITPAEGSYIKTLTLNDNSVEVVKGQPYETKIVLNSDTNITTEVVQEFSVTAEAGTGGSIKLNNRGDASLKVDNGTKVNVEVTPESGYQIDSVYVNNEKQTFEGNTFTKEITVDKDTVVKANFVRVYTVTVTSNENGEIKITNPETSGGTVTVNAGSYVTVKATPKENYRVSQVTKNGKPYSISGANDSGFEKNIEVTEDFTIVITFALNSYNVTYDKKEGDEDKGTVSVPTNPVEYDTSANVTVASKPGYSIKKVVVVREEEGKSVEDEVKPEDVQISDTTESAISFTLEKIISDLKVKVEFEESSTTNMDDNDVFDFNKTDAVRNNGNLYVFKKDAKVVFSTIKEDVKEKNGIKIYKYDDEGQLQPVGGAWNEQEVSITKTTSIGKISLYYKADGEYGKSWHDIEFSKNNPLKIVIDITSPEVNVTPEEANEYKYYNTDVKVDIDASDSDDYSGIASIDYVIGYYYTKEGVEEFKQTCSGNLYTYEKTKPIEQNVAIKDGKFVVPVKVNGEALNNRDGVIVRVTVKDRAGNVWTNYLNEKGEVVDNLKLNINSTPPTVEVKIENEKYSEGDSEGKEKEASEEAQDSKYYNIPRTATITFTDRATTFNETAAEASIKISAKDASGNEIYRDAKEGDDEYERFKYASSVWNSREWTVDPKDDNKHILTITFNEDANYVLSIGDYTNKAGLSLSNNKDGGITEIGENVDTFTVDTTAPKAQISIDKDNFWKSLLETLTFGIYKNKVKATAEGTDDTTGIQYIRYYKSTDKNPLSLGDLEEIFTKDTKYETEPISVDENENNEKFVIYARVTDLAGNSKYVSTNGIIYDSEKPEVSISLPKANENGYYNSDVEFAISVNEDKEEGVVYSGIQKITCVIETTDTEAKETYEFNLGENTKKDSNTTYYNLKEYGTANMHSWTDTKPVDKDTNAVISSWTGNITIDAKKFNSNNVVVTVTAVDNAGNEHKVSTKKGDIKIDATAPVIDVTYDNNNADNSKYFNNDRTATIVVTERNFKSDDVQVKITNTDGVIPKLGEWTETKGTGSSDDTKWTTTVTYNADGDYTFDINYTDLADNKCTSKRYGNSVAPTAFTIDKTLPVVSVSYSNNNARNEKYFDAPRTATIVVNEHNFDVNRVEFTQTAALNGTNIDIPKASWTNNGDIHTATILFDGDGDYTFDVAVTDMAANETKEANYGDNVAGKDFVVDQTIDNPVIGGVKNGSAYKGDVVPTVSFSDINYESYEVRLVRTSLGKKNIDVTSEFIKGVTENAQGGEGSFDTFEKVVKNDGIYTLTVKLVDKAGHEATEECTFTLNRFGSVYEYSDDLVDLIRDGGQYVTSVKEDLVITEYNATRILKDSLKLLVTRDGEPVDVDYTSSPAAINAQANIGDSGWYQYVYTIKASNFAEDGVYKISLTSKYSAEDSASNESVSVPDNSMDSKGKGISDAMTFTVDSVTPEIRNIVNLDKKIVDKDKIVDGKLNVRYTIVDVGGLKSIEVIVNDKTVQTLNEEDIADNAYNFTGSFDIEEQDSTTAQKIRIKATDLAGNVTDTDSADFLSAHSENNADSTFVFHNEVTVSRNFFVRWYANKALFWGPIGAVIVLAAAACFVVSAKKRKQEAAK